MKEIKRVSAGVRFESDVLRFLDLLVTEQQRNRSFIINQIVRAYARLLHQQKHPEPPQGPERSLRQRISL